MKIFVLIFLCTFLSVACQHKPIKDIQNNSMERETKMPKNKMLETIFSSYERLGLVEQEFTLINNQQDLEKIYTALNLTRKPGLPIPTIDFTKERFLVGNIIFKEGNFNDFFIVDYSHNQNKLQINYRLEKKENLNFQPNARLKLYKLQSTANAIGSLEEK